MASTEVVEVVPGLSDHMNMLYPLIDVSGLPAVDALRVKTHTEGMRLFAWALIFFPEWLAKSGNVLRGYSFRQSQKDWLLVARVTYSGIPLVGFFTSSNTMGCIRLLQDVIERSGRIWYPDKYA